MRFLSLGLLLFLCLCPRGDNTLPVARAVTIWQGKDRRLRSYSIELTNNASKTLTILSKSLKGSAFSFGTSGTDQDQSLVQHRVAVIFTPKTARSTDGVITITSNAPDSLLRSMSQALGSATWPRNWRSAGEAQFRQCNGGIERQPTGNSHGLES